MGNCMSAQAKDQSAVNGITAPKFTPNCGQAAPGTLSHIMPLSSPGKQTKQVTQRQSSNTLEIPQSPLQQRNHLFITPTVSADITPRTGLLPSANQLTHRSGISIDMNGSPAISSRRCSGDKPATPQPIHRRRPSTPLPQDVQRARSGYNPLTVRRNASISFTPAAASTAVPSSVQLSLASITSHACSPTIHPTSQAIPEADVDLPLLSHPEVKEKEFSQIIKLQRNPAMASSVQVLNLNHSSAAGPCKQWTIIQPSSLHARRHIRSSSLPQIELQKCLSLNLSGVLPAESKDDQCSAKEREPVEPSTASLLADQHCREAQLRRRNSIPNLALRPLEAIQSQHSKKAGHRRRASECSLQEAEGFTGDGIHALTSSTRTIRKPPTALSLNIQQLFKSRTFSLPPGSIFDEYATSADRLKYRQVVHLCADLLDAFIVWYRARVVSELESKNLLASDARVENQLCSDLPYLIGDGHTGKSKQEWVEMAAKKMWKAMDFNQEGQVTKTKFIATFQKAAAQVINLQHMHKANATGGTPSHAENVSNGACLMM